METKIAFIALDILGATWVVKSMVTKIDNLKEAILFIVLLAYSLARFYFYIRRQHVLLRKEMFEQMEKEKKFEIEYKK